jgi:GNAT superfamily N-acetyltransferase
MQCARLYGEYVRLLALPDLTAADESWAWAIDGIAQVTAAHHRATFGNTDMVPPQISGAPQPDLAYQRRRGVVTDREWVVLGYAIVRLPLRSNPDLAFLDVVVDPAQRRRGIGTRLADWAEQTAAAQSRRSWVSWVGFDLPPAGAPTVAVAGSDPAPAEAAGLVFALARGYTLRQVERCSSLNLATTPDLVTELDEGVRAAARQGYRLHYWHGLPPEHWLAKLARLTTVMTRDAPAGQVSHQPDTWDADRARDTVLRQAAAGRDTVTVAAEHLASADLVAYTDLLVPRADRPAAEQEDTVVDPAHRRRGLARTLKTAALVWLRRDYPHIERVFTWNDSGNAPMLAVNTRLGFRPVGGGATVQRGDDAAVRGDAHRGGDPRARCGIASGSPSPPDGSLTQ